MIDDGDRVQPARVGVDVGDVSTPQAVGLGRFETPLHQVGRHRQVALAVGGHHELALGLGPYAVLVHQFAHAVFAYADAAGQQFFVHAWPAILAFGFDVNDPDIGQQGFVTVPPRWATLATILLPASQPVKTRWPWACPEPWPPPIALAQPALAVQPPA